MLLSGARFYFADCQQEGHAFLIFLSTAKTSTSENTSMSSDDRVNLEDLLEALVSLWPAQLAALASAGA